ncbi:MAG: IS66 family transposase [Chloroflexota bacterium]
MIAYLHERHHVSFERLVELCKDLFGVQLSEGAVSNVLQRLGDRGQTRYPEIKEAVRASPVIGSDETGARVAGRNRWHWNFQTKTASYHVIARTRSGSVIDDFLDGAVPEVWQSDAYAPQLRAPAKTGQLCLAHQLRELTRAAELEPDAAWWATELRHVFGRGMRLHAERAQISAESFQRRKVRIINAAKRLIEGPPLGKGMARRLQQRYQRLWSELFVFLERDRACPERSERIEPTNNASERDLRNSVIHRKVTGGYRSEWGSQTSAILTSVLQTARKQGQNLYAAIRMLSGPSPLAAPYAS